MRRNAAQRWLRVRQLCLLIETHRDVCGWRRIVNAHGVAPVARAEWRTPGGVLFLRGSRETVAFLELGGGLSACCVGGLALCEEFSGAFIDPARLEVGLDFTGETLRGLGWRFFQIMAAGGEHGSKGEQGEK